MPAGPYVNASDATIIGNHATRSPQMNWSANSGPQLNGGRSARHAVLRASTAIAPTSEIPLRSRVAPGTRGRGSETRERDGDEPNCVAPSTRRARLRRGTARYKPEPL